MKYFAFIPSKVLHDKELPPNSKLLYGEILSMCCGERVCTLNYDEISMLYGCTKATISKWISALEKQGYIIKHCSIPEGSNNVKLQQIILLEDKHGCK